FGSIEGRGRAMPDRWREELADLSLVEVADRIESRELSPVKATRAALDRIEALDGTLNAFVTVLAGRALAEAKEAERTIAAGGYRGPLHGVPVSVKDLFFTEGIRTTAGSRVLADHVPDEDATIVRRLRQAGAIVVGKTNMLEFAYATVHPDYGPSPNPWDLQRSSSGSSSGSAVAVAAGMGYGSIGSDTGGSIRLPASYCGIVGLKPTYGRVSRHGAVPVSWSCDHVGPMTRTVADCAALLGVIAGEDKRDPSSGRVPVPHYLGALGDGVAGKRVGIADAYLRQNVDGEVVRAVETAVAQFERLGAQVVEVTLPPPAEAVPALIAILTPEATVYHLPWLRQRPDDYTQAVRERLELGAITPAVSYIQAQRLRRRIADDFLAAMEGVDVLAMPTGPTAATPLEGDLVTSDEADPALLASLINFTGPFDLTGFPAVSIPCGFTDGGLPIGLQLVGKPYAEASLLAVANAYEQATDWHRRVPSAVAI
ncbi:MAG TPA: amidase, partial [Thermomicrobiales bacterium]|nr:amidase [Thermomicrobiales bacterium]